jgi:radical SAM family RiPP maturation amino acid epimerase
VIAFELSEGCSIGCWFCGISASRFAGHWPYQEHALEWQAILDRTVAFFGPAAGTGFCYWGTDPSDNPDYTDFVVDFVRATGMVPMTTTAAPLRDLPMVRRIIPLADRNQGLPNRFSILTPRQLQDLFMVFSPDELLHVDLVLHMRGSLQPKSVAGRARSRRAAIADSATIACVSGFLVNLPRRHVRLVTPVPSSVAEPDGFRVLGEADFTDPASFGAVLQDLADRHMVQGLRHDDKLRLRPEVEYAPTADGFVLTQGKFHHTVSGDIAARLGRSLSDGGHTVGDVCAAPETDFRTLLEMSRTVETLFDAGLLREPDERAQAA